MCTTTDKTSEQHYQQKQQQQHHRIAAAAATAAAALKGQRTVTPRLARKASHATHHDTTTAACHLWSYYQLPPAYLLRSIRTLKPLDTAAAALVASAAPKCQRRLCHWLALVAFALALCMRGACAAPQSCILCDKDDLKAKEPHSSSNSYEEFLFEHQVTRQDAINALKALNESFYIGPSPDNSCKSVTCTKKVMKYCLGPQFINDHCWCELGHTDEGLPFVPHICYVGEKVYTASVGSCFFYEEVKECCCAPALAKQWRHISGASHSSRNSLSLICLALLMLYAAGHGLRSSLWRRNQI